MDGININKNCKILKGFFKKRKAINSDTIVYYGDGNNDYLNFDEECVYEGSYKNDKKDGYGKFSMINGEFRNECYKGKWIYKWNNGLIYIGKFKNNRIEGFGDFTIPNFGKKIRL